MCASIRDISGQFLRAGARQANAMRPVRFIRQYTEHAEGSVWVAYGKTQVLCNVSVQMKQVPRFRKGTGLGWLTAEYAMLPRATADRTPRSSQTGGRCQEIQRLIGRTLRSCVDFKALGEHTLYVDCDVIQADGGTRTAAITGACLALYDAVQHLRKTGVCKKDPWLHWVGAVSVGLCDGQVLLDLDYREDSQADTDMNVIMNEQGHYLEVQGSAEKRPFSATELSEMLRVAEQGVRQLLGYQQAALD